MMLAIIVACVLLDNAWDWFPTIGTAAGFSYMLGTVTRRKDTDVT